MNGLFSPECELITRIHDQLAHLAKIKSGMPQALGTVHLLTQEQLSTLIETAFWASLRSNEGRTTRVCLVVAPPEGFYDGVKFEVPIAYDESLIAKLAPAVPRRGCLVVSESCDGFSIWGFGRSRPGHWADTVTIEMSEPGTLRVGVGPFQPFAVLNGRSNFFIAGIELAHHLQRVLRKALPVDDILETQAVRRECLALADLARMIVADGHGGIVLIVPSETDEWLQSLNPFAYRFALPDKTIRDVIRQELQDAHAQGQILQQLSEAAISDDLKNLAIGAMRPSPWGGMRRGIRDTASLAGVDGAIVITRDLQVLGFGAKIAIPSDAAPHVCMFRPEPGSQPVVPSPLEDVGGTRHQSAARFAFANPDAVAIVISQDRHLSVMHWDEQIRHVVTVRNAEWWM